jgi:redoxin
MPRLSDAAGPMLYNKPGLGALVKGDAQGQGTTGIGHRRTMPHPHRKLHLTSASVAILAAGLCAAAGASRGAERPASRPSAPATAAASVELNDVDGVPHRPLHLGGAKAAVVLFIRHDCPVSNGYAPEVARIIAAYSPRNVKFFLVHVDPDLPAKEARAHAKEFHYPTNLAPVLLDGKRVLATKLGATVTPEAVVVSESGEIAYRGRIDDKYYAYGKNRAEPTVRDLRAALDAVLDGKPAPAARTKAIGCPIE